MKMGRVLFEQTARCVVLFASTASVVAALQIIPPQLIQTLQLLSLGFQGGSQAVLLLQIIGLVVLSPLKLLMEIYLLLLMMREVNQAPTIWHWRCFRKRWPAIPVVLGIALPIVLIGQGVGLQFR